MDLELGDRAAVVMASTSGLGLAVARALAREGAAVAISGRDAARLAAASAQVAAAGARDVLADALDVTDTPALVAHLERARARFGAVDVLVTNAGGPPPGSAAGVGEADLERARRLTLESAIHAVQTVLPWMRERRFGRIMALTSLSVRQPIANLALSNTYRAALTGWLKTLAGEVGGDGVRVNSVCTGLFETERLAELFEKRARASGRTPAAEREAAIAEIPARRLGRPEEMGDLVAFLCSPRADYLHGAALAFDGGLTRGLL